MGRQACQLVVVQLEVDQLPQLTEVGGQSLKSVLAEVQVLEGALEAGEAKGWAEGLQVVVVKHQLGQRAEVADGGGQLLDMVVAEVQLAEELKREHAHVHTGQLAVGHLQVLQGEREVGRQRIVLLGDDHKLLLGFLHIPGADWRKGRERHTVCIISSMSQACSREEVLETVGISLREQCHNKVA